MQEEDFNLCKSMREVTFWQVLCGIAGTVLVSVIGYIWYVLFWAWGG